MLWQQQQQLIQYNRAMISPNCSRIKNPSMSHSPTACPNECAWWIIRAQEWCQWCGSVCACCWHQCAAWCQAGSRKSRVMWRNHSPIILPNSTIQWMSVVVVEERMVMVLLVECCVVVVEKKEKVIGTTPLSWTNLVEQKKQKKLGNHGCRA